MRPTEKNKLKKAKDKAQSPADEYIKVVTMLDKYGKSGLSGISRAAGATALKTRDGKLAAEKERRYTSTSPTLKQNVLRWKVKHPSWPKQTG